MDADNLQPPALGPQFPIYPPLDQVVRVTSAGIPQPGGAKPVYPGITQQMGMPNLSLRDRESCFVIEPNGILLGPGYYDARLVGTYNNTPLYATTCCSGGSFSSSSAISSYMSSLMACNLIRTPKGTATAPIGAKVVSKATVTIANNSLLLVVAVHKGLGAGPLVTWGAAPLTQDVTVNLPIGSPQAATMYLYSLWVGSGNTGTVSYSTTNVTQGMGIQIVQIQGLAIGSLDRFATNAGSNSQPGPGTGGYSPLNYPCEFAQGAFMFFGVDGTWASPFIEGGQDITIGGLHITEGYAPINSSQSPSLDGISPTQWAGLVGTYP